MSENSLDQRSEGYDEEIDLVELVSVIWRGWHIILLSVILGSGISVAYALSLPNIYSAETKLAPKGASDGLSGITGRLGGLAGLAGIELGGGETSKTQIALETLKSRTFFAEYLYEEVLVALMAAKGWDSVSGELILDNEIYDAVSKTWVRAESFPFKRKPSVQEAYLVFRGNHFSIDEDKATGFVTLSISHFSPVVARDWVEKISEFIESSVRARDVADAERSIEFLKGQSAENSLVSLNEVFSNLIEEQTKTIVLAHASEEYLFQVIEPPIISELKSSPNRSLICFFGLVLSGILSVLFVLVRHYSFNRSKLKF